jgi:hypothetical protein
MRTLRLAALILIAMLACISARAQTVSQITVTNTAVNVPATTAGFYAVLYENSVTPTAAFSVQVAQVATGGALSFGAAVNIAAGGAYTFSKPRGYPFAASDVLGKITATTAGPFNFILVQYPAVPGDGALTPTKCPTGYAITEIKPDGTMTCTLGAGTGGGVSSFNTRIGAVTLLSADIPNNSANTSGNAGTATALASTPTKCSAGNYPLGIDVNGNAQNCTTAAGSGVTTFNSRTGAVTPATNDYSFSQISSLLLHSQLPTLLVGDIPTLNQNSTGYSAATVESFTVGTGGVTANTLVQTDLSAPSKIVAATTGAYGVALSTVSAAGTVNVQRSGQVPCVTDTGGATAGDLVVIGTGTVVDCKDSGQTASSGIAITVRIIGVFLTSASAGATAQVELLPAHFGTALIPSTGSGNVVLATSPTLTTPNLGTPSALVLTNATGLPCAALPALTGDTTTSSGSCATTTAKINGTAYPTSAGVVGSNSSAQPVAATAHGIVLPKTCADSSGSGTAQSCTTSPSFTPASGDQILYSTTTNNSGDVTVNVNSLGAKHIRKWSASAVLASGDLVANVPITLIYDGTFWEIPTIGNAPSGGSSTGPPRPNTKRWAYCSTNGGSTLSGVGDNCAAAGVGTLINPNSNDPSMIEFATGASTGNNNYTLGGGGSGGYFYMSSRNPLFQASWGLPDEAAGSQRAWLGLTTIFASTLFGSATPTGNLAAFRFDTSASDTTMHCVTGNGTTTTDDGASGVTLDANVHDYEISINSATPSVTFKIDGTSVCGSPITTTPPTSTAIMSIADGIQTLANVIKHVRTGWIYVESDK